MATLWTVAEVADYLRVSRSWVYHRAAAGLLPCLHLGALLRFDPESIRAYAQGAPTITGAALGATRG
jgi:excisionase family DNA binding protein